MAHIAICTSTLKGLLYASYKMASRLILEGHTVTYLCPLDIKKDIENNGFNYIEVPNTNFSPHIEAIKNKSWIDKFKAHFFSSDLKYETLKLRMHIPEYKNVLLRLKPDLVLCDIELHEIILTTYSLKIPLHLLSPWFCMRRVSGLPCIRSSAIPGNGLKGSYIGMQLFWLKTKCKIYGRYFLDILNFKNYRRSTIKAYGKEIGFPIKNLVPRNFPENFIYNDLNVISLTIREMEFPHKSPKNLKYAGAMVYENRSSKEFMEEDDLRLSSIFDSKNKENKKLIYCGMGSFVKGDATFIQKIFEVLKKEPNWVLIISLGKTLKIEDFKKIPKNVHVFNWVSQPRLLKHMDCCINHAGINTINECIHNKVPMLVYSSKKYDQDGCSARVKYHGLGIVRDKDSDSSENIKQAITKLITEKSYKKSLDKFYKIHQNYQKKSISKLLEI